MTTNGTLSRYPLTIVALLLFTGLFAQPVITSVSPLSGPPSTTVTITGTGFGSGYYGNIINFGAQRGLVVQADPTSIQVKVPFGATYQYITVTTNGLTAYSPRPFIPTFGLGGIPITAGTFPERLDSSTGLNPMREVIVDLDGDGRDDIATANNANSPTSTISVLLNTGGPNGPGKPTTISFAPKADFDAPTAAIPNSIAYGDIDGDGKIDLIATSLTTNSAPSMISIFKNASSVGQANFSARTDLTATSGPYDVAVGDLDGDGKPDLVVTNFLSNSISIFRNTSTTGKISFAPKIDLTTALAPHSVIIADLDGDGKTDIAVTNSFSGSFSVFRNQSTSGNPSFATRSDFTTGTDEPFSLAAGDLDGDGKQDIVVSNYNFNSTSSASTSFSVFRNSSIAGNISFSSKTDYASGDAFYLTMSDLNGDGRPDIILPNLNGISVYQNNSSSGFIQLGTPVSFSFFSPFQAQAGDFDNDGKADLAVANFNLSAVSVLKNNTYVPVIGSVLPDSAGVGMTVKLVGSNFANVSAVSFGGVPATSFTLIAPDTIAAVLGSGATGDVSVTTPNGIGVLSNGFTFVATPSITSYTPTSGTTGDAILISGNDLTNASAVSFGGRPAASFTIFSPTTISAIVGTGSTGDITVTTRGGTGTATGFLFTGPAISSFSPNAGQAGTVVTITGTNFTGATTVSFGGVAATSFTVNSATSITAIVGSGASGDVLVRTPGGTGTLSGFTHHGPAISSFSPIIAGAGSQVTIKGINFNATTAVSFGTTPAISFTVISDTVLRATVGTGSSGDLTVTTSFGSATASGFAFTTQPIITSLTPAKGAVGSTVIINGANFNATPANNIVYFGAVRAIVTNAGANQLTVTVPSGATLQAVSVTIAGFTAWSPLPFDVTFASAILAPASFANRTDISLMNTPTSATYAAVIGDLDGDGKPDLAATNFDRHTVSLLKNATTDTLSYAPKIDLPVPGYPNNVQLSDLDGDGMPDMAVLSSGLSVFRNTGSLGFSLSGNSSTINAVPDNFTIADIDGDGKPDIIASGAGETGGSAYISVFRNTSSISAISFAPRFDITTTNFTSADAGQYIAAGDLDGDGRPDLIVTNSQQQTLSLYRNTTSGATLSFAAPVQYNTNGSAGFTVVGDLDGDGRLDIAGANFDGYNAYIFRNTSTPGTLSLDKELDLGAGSDTRGIALGDLDGDGKPDLVFVNSLSDNLSVLKNNSTKGSISFGPQYNYKTGSFPQSVAIGDLDNDSKPELVVSDYGGSISILHNTIGNLRMSSFSPAGAGVNDTVTIKGANFTGAVAVSLGGKLAQSFIVVSDSVIKAIVNDGASNGTINVQTPEGTVSLPGFRFLPTPYAQLTGPDEFCEGDSVLLTSTIITNIQWNKDGKAIPAATTPTIKVGAAGNYTVTATIDTFKRTSYAVQLFTIPTPPKPVITLDAGNTLHSSATDGNQWYTGPAAPISGATAPSYKPDSSGSYSVKVTEGGCSSAFSDVYAYVKPLPTPTGGAGTVQIGPNPATDFIRVSFDPTGAGTVVAKITDFRGNILLEVDNVQNGQNIPVQQLPRGVYVLKIISSTGKINSAILFTKL